MLWKSFIWTAFHGDRKCEYQTLRRWHTTENCAMKSALSLHAYIKRGWDISKLTKNGRECEIFYKNWGTGDFLKRELNDFLSFWIFQIGDFFLNKILDIKNRSWKVIKIWKVICCINWFPANITFMDKPGGWFLLAKCHSPAGVFHTFPR